MPRCSRAVASLNPAMARYNGKTMPLASWPGNRIVLFAVLNLEEIRVDVLVTSVKVPVVFVIVATGLVGFGAGYLLARHLENRD